MIARQDVALRSSMTEVLPTRERRLLPNAKSKVPLSSSHGTRCRKVCCGVFSNSSAPAQPPATLVTSRGTKSRTGTLSRFKYARVLAAKPGQSATVLVALACTGGTPRNRRAGKERKLPPPAKAFSVPATYAAKNRKTNWRKCKSMKDYRTDVEVGLSYFIGKGEFRKFSYRCPNLCHPNHLTISRLLQERCSPHLRRAKWSRSYRRPVPASILLQPTTSKQNSSSFAKLRDTKPSAAKLVMPTKPCGGCSNLRHWFGNTCTTTPSIMP